MDSFKGILTDGLACGPACQSLILGGNRLFVAVTVSRGSLSQGGGFPMAPGTSLDVLVPRGQLTYSVKIDVKAFGNKWSRSLLLKKHAMNAVVVLVNGPTHIKLKWDMLIDNIKTAIPRVRIMELKNAIQSITISTIRKSKPLAKIFNLRRRDK